MRTYQRRYFARILRGIPICVLMIGAIIAKAELPEESRELLDKLAEFERQERAKAEANINEKRRAVVGILESQMKERTKKGELDPALAIKAAVDSLKANVSSPESTPMSATIEQAENTPESDSRAPRDAIRHGGARFRAYVTEEPITWEAARKECQSVGGELAWFDSPEDESLIKRLLEIVNGQAGHVAVWVGGRKDENGNWIWINGEPVDPEFWATEGDSVTGGTDEVMVRWIGSFKPAGPDSTKVGYLCRWE